MCKSLIENKAWKAHKGVEQAVKGVEQAIKEVEQAVKGVEQAWEWWNRLSEGWNSLQSSKTGRQRGGTGLRVVEQAIKGVEPLRPNWCAHAPLMRSYEPVDDFVSTFMRSYEKVQISMGTKDFQLLKMFLSATKRVLIYVAILILPYLV